MPHIWYIKITALGAVRFNLYVGNGILIKTRGLLCVDFAELTSRYRLRKCVSIFNEKLPVFAGKIMKGLTHRCRSGSFVEPRDTAVKVDMEIYTAGNAEEKSDGGLTEEVV